MQKASLGEVSLPQQADTNPQQVQGPQIWPPQNIIEPPVLQPACFDEDFTLFACLAVVGEELAEITAAGLCMTENQGPALTQELRDYISEARGRRRLLIKSYQDKGMTPDRPAFTGLFKQALF